MGKSGSSVVTAAVIAVIALVIGSGAVFALNSPTAKADSVVVLKAQGVTCGSCAGKIEKALRENPGVASVQVDVDVGRVTVAYDGKSVKPETLAENVTALGYGSSILQVVSAEEYKSITGRTVASLDTPKAGGCGGGCCNKNRK